MGLLIQFLANRSMGDMQVNAEYVAYNLHYLSYLSGGLPTAVVAHSQGNPVGTLCLGQFAFEIVLLHIGRIHNGHSNSGRALAIQQERSSLSALISLVSICWVARAC